LKAIVGNFCGSTDMRPAGDPGRLHHGYTLRQIWEWRCAEDAAGRPCGLADWYNAHGIPHGNPANQPIIPNSPICVNPRAAQ
jgi:hypothetical protein